MVRTRPLTPVSSPVRRSVPRVRLCGFSATQPRRFVPARTMGHVAFGYVEGITPISARLNPEARVSVRATHRMGARFVRERYDGGLHLPPAP